MPLELFSDCFRNVKFPVFLLKTTIPSETEEGPDIFKLHEAAMFVYNSHTDAIARDFRVGNLLACILVSILRAVQKTLSSLLNSLVKRAYQECFRLLSDGWKDCDILVKLREERCVVRGNDFLILYMYI